MIGYGVYFIRLISPFYLLANFNQIYAGIFGHTQSFNRGHNPDHFILLVQETHFTASDVTVNPVLKLRFTGLLDVVYSIILLLKKSKKESQIKSE